MNIRRCAVAIATFILVTTSTSAQVVRSGAGTLADVTVTRDLFRADLGGGDTAGSAGSFGGVRREINWDGTPDAFSQPNPFPGDFFNTRSPRGVVFTSAANSGFGVSAKVGNPSATPALFADLDPLYGTLFAAFSPERLFASLGTSGYEAVFLVPGTNKPAVVSGFGAVLVDVDLPGSSFLEYYDIDGNSLGRFDFPVAGGNGRFSFVGVSFPTAIVARVYLGVGDVVLAGGGEPLGHDAVVADDFIFGEPIEVPGAPCVATPTALCFLDGRFRVEATFSASNVGDGVAQVQPLSDNSGTMSFFQVENREVLIKVLDGCALNQAFWVFGAAATNVGYTITVTDTTTGLFEEYSKEEGPPAPAINDTAAFANCS